MTDRKLKEAAEWAEGIIAAIPDILFVVDRAGRYLKVWAKSPDMLATPEEALLGKTVREVLPPEVAAAAMEAIAEADEKGVSCGATFNIVLPGGESRWFEHYIAKKPGRTPSADTFLVLSRDVTAHKQAEQALEKAHTRLLSVLQTIPDMVWMKDEDGVFLFCNHAVERVTGKQEADLVGKTDYDLFETELADFIREQDRAAIAAGRIRINEEWIPHHDSGQPIFLETRKVPVHGADGKVTGVLGMARDITEQKRMQAALAEREREFRTLVENSPDLVMRYDRDLRRLYVNPALVARLGADDASALIGKKPSDTGWPNAEAYERSLREVFTAGKPRHFEMMWKRDETGPERCYLFSLTPEFGADGAVESILAVGRDITELHASRQKIHQMAFYDTLTALPNRALFNDRLHRMIADAGWHGRRAGVMMIDIDHFKMVNDTMGHAIGDKLLHEAAVRLNASVRNSDTVARLGGDEFAILLPGIRESDDLGRVAAKIFREFDEPFLLDGRELFTSCCIGIALYPDDGVDGEDLVKYADSAMYSAKRRGGRTFRFYSRDMTASARERLILESELRRAVERDELELHYQPKVLLRTGTMIGSEALLRWRHRQFGMVPPGRFIQIAEESGLIVDLGRWVLREGCSAAAEWNAEGMPLHKVAINLSARQFQAQDLVKTVADILDETGCNPKWIELEITESLLLDENGRTLDMLSALRAMGVSIAIDDFGTGYSALSYLARFPIDTLKIDRSFISSVTTEHYRAELVKAVLSIARCLGQQVVAEGVETAEQAAFLAAHNCQVAQGFLYSKPVPKHEIAALMRRFNGADPAAWTPEPTC